MRREYGARLLLLTDSGTSALRLALAAAATERPGLPVALPGYACYDLATAAVGAGVPVALYDLDAETLGPDFQHLKRIAARGLAAIVVVHLYGVPVDLAQARAVAVSANTLLIEDAAQGTGGTYDGVPLGGHGSLAVLSFGRGKGVTAGRGGALLANDERGERVIGDRAFAVRSGIAESLPLLAQWLLARPSLYGIPAAIPWLKLGQTVYKAPRASRGMSAFALGVLATTWALREDAAKARRITGDGLHELIGRSQRMTAFHPVSGAVPGYLRFPVRARDPKIAGSLASSWAQWGAMRGYPTSLDRVGPLRSLIRDLDPLPRSAMLAETLLTFRTPVSERMLHALYGERLVTR